MAFIRLIVLGFASVYMLTAEPIIAAAEGRGPRAEAVILDLSETARRILSRSDKPLRSRERELIATIGQHFHFTLISELVIGPSWINLPQHQRQEFLTLFRDFYLHSYGSQLGGYPGDQFTILRVKEKGSRDTFVTTRLTRLERDAVVIDWRFREVMGKPLIIDILINGTSVAISHREGFQPVVAGEGIGGLIALFQIRAERLNAETRGFAAGELFEQGRFAEAVAIWEELAKKGNPEAQFNLSIMYADGRGVEPDSIQADYWNDRALKSGYPPAQHNHALGLLARKEEKAAIALLEKAANSGFAPSQYTLGKMYSYGLGVAETPARAFEFIRLAALSGLPEAQYNLGKIYRDGYGTTADEDASLTWFERAARQGHGKAQAKLAARYGRGEGVAHDDVEALKWAILAAGDGEGEGTDFEKLYKGRMTEADIARAEQLAANFKPEREAP
jgi:TPR repeat protein